MKGRALLGITLLVSAIACLAISKYIRQINGSISVSKSKAEAQIVESQVSPTPNCKKFDPLNPTDEGYNEYLLSHHGYQSDTSIAEAVNRFNQDSECTEIGKAQPKLTEAEVLASVCDAIIIYNKELDPIIRDSFERILKDRIMPKGSLIDVDMGYRSPKYNLDYWHIYIYVGLDKYPKFPHDGDRNRKKNRYLIRKQFISMEPIITGADFIRKKK